MTSSDRRKEGKPTGAGASVPGARELAAKLAGKPGAGARSDVAKLIGATLDLGGLSESEREAAQDIVRALAKDAETRVRRNLAQAVARSTRLDPQVAKALADDTPEIAEPILGFSSVLDDADLTEIVRSGDEAKQLAIAGRERLSGQVSGALVDHGSEEVVVAVVSNPGAELSEGALGRAVDRFGESERLQTPLVARTSLPVAIAERLVSMVSDRLREELVSRHALSEDVASDLILDSRERATLSLVASDDRERTADELVRELHRNGRLSDSIIVRAACTGDIAFLEAALSLRAGVPTRNARQLIHDPGHRGFEALIEKAALGSGDRTVLRCALDVIKETELGDRPGDRERFGRLVIERVLTTFDADAAGLDEDDAEYLIHRLEGYTSTAA